MFRSDDGALSRGSDYKNNVGLAIKKVNPVTSLPGAYSNIL